MDDERRVTALHALALLVVVVPGLMVIRAQMEAPLIRDAFVQFGEGLKIPWMAMVASDLFAGFALMSAWVWYREGRAWIRWIVIASLWFWGNLAIGIYLLYLLSRRGTSIRMVLLGRFA